MANCNFTYSLLGIETTFAKARAKGDNILQFHLLPIRDWNIRAIEIKSIKSNSYCNFTYSLLGIETNNLIPVSEHNENCNFTYSLLGIETRLLVNYHHLL